METLPCTGAHDVGESDRSEHSLQIAYKYDGKSELFLDAEQVGKEDLKANDLVLNGVESHELGEDGGQFILERFPSSEGCSNVDMYNDFDADRQNLSGDSHDSEDDHLDQRDHFSGPNVALDHSQIVFETGESGLPYDKQEGLCHPEIRDVELDEAQAVWVKWRGKWQSGIRCARADWPLLTVKAKPTHDRKQYLVIFFPRTRNYSWADVQLVRPISEYPEPIAYKTHKVGLKMVKDLTLARRFIMQKLAVSMLNILDQLHLEALVESARDMMVLKEFAMEASRSKFYSDLGRMLLKLQNMILQSCLNSHWLQHSLQPWMQQCQNADNAECIELLKEELNDSILWYEVNSRSSSASSMELGSDWKSWKQEVMKCFSVSHPICSTVGSNEPVNDNALTGGLQISRKRPKLEVRRADTHVFSLHHSAPSETNSSFFNGYGVVNCSALNSEAPTTISSQDAASPAAYTGCVSDKWDDIIVEAGNVEVIQAKDVGLTPSASVTPKFQESGDRNRQCIAFIESKGRQCVRYANEGDVYCCVHLASRFAGNSAKAEAMHSADSPMCGGTTVLGTKCKHRALIGSAFCKKHRPLDGKNMISAVPNFKRKSEETVVYPESKSPTQSVLDRVTENPARVDPLLDVGKDFISASTIIEKPEQLQQAHSSDEMVECIGSWPQVENDPCLEIPKRHSLYCEKHIPSWLKRARNGKTRIVSKEVFIDLLKDCHSREQKLQLHQACELFYRLLKSILSLRNPVPKEVQFQWAISEASKDPRVGEFMMKLVHHEKERLRKLWGLGVEELEKPSSTIEELVPISMLMSHDRNLDENVIKCKICSEMFLDDQVLGKHWIDSHKKEAQWLFRGYVCAICLDSFTNKKVLEAHVQERHRVEFVEQCMLLQCIPCDSHFGNQDQLWLHVLSSHPSHLRLSNATLKQDEGTSQKVEPEKQAPLKNSNPGDQLGTRRFVCRFCGLKFDLLPDLGRHHQAAHMDQNFTGPRLTKKGIQFYAHKLKSGRLTRPRFKRGLSSASYKIRNRLQSLKNGIIPSKSVNPVDIMVQSNVPEASTLGRLADSQCSAVAKLLFSEIKKTKLQPSILEILSVARSACCKVNLVASLEVSYENLPEKICLKAAKLCSEHDILVEWHREGFICPKGCTPSARSPILSPLVTSSDYTFKGKSSIQSHLMTSEWTMDECHCVIDSRHFSLDLSEKNIILCDDISFGHESVPIACVVDENLLNAEGPDERISESFPWENFTYITKSLIDQSLILEAESSQLGCSCAHSTCFSATCDHVYLFDNDYDDAKDIYGKPMNGRFPYDERGRIILEEGYLVYECNQRCCCSRACQNRVLQNGVQLKLEIFKTEKKGWAVRAREAILRGTFVCECIGEVIDEQEANERRNSYGKEGCRYFYEIDARINDMSRLIEGQAPYVVDATNYGNVSRFINHSCSPNLVNHQVLVESMDSQLAHIGLYANRDISLGEELTYDFCYKLLPGEGCLCLCGASNCRGRLY
ncbi:histone-lysine N-methyltransferase SUVR5-like isoform X1 [Primulina eburnea]|uniref:histone-lysine N-methyltransferase SUVR5-like isoform X1 n=1 Tax=Primulina eburnea TaxID=1245227 RepID=UPI003C6BE5F3